MLKKYLSFFVSLLLMIHVVSWAMHTASSAHAASRPSISNISIGHCDMNVAPEDTLDSINIPEQARPDTLESATPTSTNALETAQERSLRLIGERLDELAQSPLFDRSQLGMCVYDLTEGKMIFKRGAAQRLRPASTMKALTAICAVDILGGNYNFVTEMRSSAPLTPDTLVANLYIKGVMDPLFGKEDLKRFAECLTDSAVTYWRGDLVLDISYKDTLSAGWGWCWDDENPSLSPLLCDEENTLAQTFAEVLRENQIQWEGQVVIGTMPTSAICLAKQRHSLDQVLMPMLKKSSNQKAEALFYSIAAQSGEKYAGRPEAAHLINELISKKLNLDPDDYKIADGSGLSLYNYVTPELMVALLRHAYENENIYRHIKPTLPIMGVDGTLKKRCKGDSAQGKVFAKTGTVSGVSALVGYALGAEGHVFCFAIINQGIVTSKEGRDFQDKVCNVLTRKYD